MMKDIHSYWAYLVVAILIFVVVNAIIGIIKKRTFTDKDLRLGLFTLAQLLNCDVNFVSLSKI